MKVHKKFESRGVVFLGMTSQTAKELPEINQFLESANITWPNVYGAAKTMQAFQVDRIPAVWVIGTDGKVAWNSGSEESLEEALEKALAQSSH
ncbi:MAG: hypothetical protein Tsb009_20810 [Planctomycetaceae bacterium]